jgi:predicted membrane protein
VTEYERRSGRELAGLIIILIGFGLLMNTMEIFPMFPFMPLIHRFWLPAVLIGIGVMLLSRRRGNEGLPAGLFFIVFGFLVLMGQMNFWGMHFNRWIGPGILIWVGLAFLFRNSARPRRIPRDHLGMKEFTDSSDFIQASVVLGGFNRKCPSQQFRGGDVMAIMGGGKIDLREARIQQGEAVLDIFTLMGGIEIQVPRDWRVEPRLTPILGGIEDKTTPEKDSTQTQKLIIQGTAVMGGVIVSN